MKILGLIVYFVILITLVFFGVSFAKYNAYFINMNFLGMYALNVPLWIGLLIAFTLGFLVSALLFSWKIIAVYLSKQQYLKSYEQLKNLIDQKPKED